jgi:hypothetical protein
MHVTCCRVSSLGCMRIWQEAMSRSLAFPGRGSPSTSQRPSPTPKEKTPRSFSETPESFICTTTRAALPTQRTKCPFHEFSALDLQIFWEGGLIPCLGCQCYQC